MKNSTHDHAAPEAQPTAGEVELATPLPTTAVTPAPPPPLAERLMRLGEAFTEAKILYAAVDLGLPARLSGRPATIEELVAEGFGLERGLRILADGLVALGYLEQRGGRYANTAEVDALLVPGRPGSLAATVAHRNQLFRSWAALEDVVRRGRPGREQDKKTLTDPATNRNFILTMAEASRARLAPLVEALPLDGVRRLVDLGGGPGQYACEAVRRHPGLQAEVADLPLTVQVAAEQIAAAGLSARVGTRVCDFYHQDPLELGEPADGVLISQVLHVEGPEQNAALLRRLLPCVRPGGWVAVVENLVQEDRSRPRAGALFAVNMLAGTERGNTYTEAEIAGWLRAAGFVPQPVRHLAERTALILAQRPVAR